MKRTFLAVLASLAFLAEIMAEPVFLLPGEILAPGHGEIHLSYSNGEFLKRHDGSSSASDVAAGELRRHTALPLRLRYALPGGEEVVARSSYMDLMHRVPSFGNYSRTGVGDVLLLVRSQANLWGDLRGALGMGVNIPTGRGVFDVSANEAPTGDGTWDGAASFAWADKRDGVTFHAEVTYFLRFPRTATKAMDQALTEEVRFGFAHRFQWGMSAELKASDALSLFGEMFGRVHLSQSGTYATNGADASAEINAKAFPEFYAQPQDSIWLAPMVQIQASPSLKFAGGAAWPLRLTNGYSGLMYLANASFKF